MFLFLQAGISNDHLVIALEPEAASLLCRRLPVDKMASKDETSVTSFSEGAKYMVVDAGGVYRQNIMNCNIQLNVERQP